ncbi:EpsD family peptidyl-prolyl cis-trans isomerase [Methylophilus aquaticus]|uniref:Type IV secretion system putative lipoprotein virB7 n=1 Tax=Methylophilus aquaticus TaxID=1971610 RepID=A0ABT9JTG9_9PROT|nr:EpsD family peptidyl-prolyl cis-trans isomerase [Methylophilus aquaticus]MDP8567774.1 EpsD family peptidyl-prolyl cis-trans isomerase [Methylophilus aquaticus]
MKVLMNKFLFYIFLMLVLAGCQNKEAKETGSQVLAKVNGDEITIHLLNTELKRVQGPQSGAQDIQKKMLGSVIDRQLLVQEAIKLNLDRTPEVVQLLDIARAQIYAQAYLSRKSSTLASATKQEIQQFMAEHPAIFSDRKLFTTSDVIFLNDTEKVNYNELQTLFTNNGELKKWLNNHQIKFETVEEHLPTEALPAKALPLASNIKQGDLLFMHDENRIVAREVTNVTVFPLAPEQATAMASKAINARKQQQLIMDEILRLKKLAKIEILNDSLAPDDALSISTDAGSSLLNESEKSSTVIEHGLKGL